MLCPLYLLALQVELVPLVPRVEVVCVDDVVAGPSCRLKALVCLAVVCLQKLFEVEICRFYSTSVFLRVGNVSREFFL